MAEKKMYKKLGRFFLFLSLNLCVTIGIIWIAYNNRTQIKRFLDHENSFGKEDKVILYDIFSSDLIGDEGDLVHPPVQNSDELQTFLNRSTLPSGTDLATLHDSCVVLSSIKYRDQVIKIRYLLFGDTLDSYVYLNKASEGGKPSHTAIIHIPGSGDNRPGKVARRVMDEEDPTKQALQIGADIYFPVFPADDILAIHDGKKMLDIKKISSYLVNMRRNLSLRYLADIFALKKWLSNQYPVFQIWGHSRGGTTATIASTFLFPDTLIVSSGYSVMNEKFFRLNPDQLWWPGAHVYFDKSYIKNKLGNSNTKGYFLFGNKESHDIYGLEGKYFYTEKYFKDNLNIKVRYVDREHEWFGDEISKILTGK